MSHPEAAPTPWGRGDLYTLLIAVFVFAGGCWLHRRALRAKGTECGEMLLGLMSSALTVGPLLMILVDPLNENFPFIQVDLLNIVMNEARLTLWFACFLALLNTVLGLLRSREPTV